MQPNKAIVGRNAFAHEAGIHQHGVISNPLCYEIMTPESVGIPADRMVLGKHSGRHALLHRYDELGLTLPARTAMRLHQFTQLADRKKKVYDQDLLSMLITHRGPLGNSPKLRQLNTTMNLKIAVFPGDGVGPEVTREAVRVLRAVSDLNGYDFRFHESPIGGAASPEFGSPFRSIPARVVWNPMPCCWAPWAARNTILCPANSSRGRYSGAAQGAGVFANLRPAIAYEAVADCSPIRAEVLRGANILIVRELLGGLYFGQPRGLDEPAAPTTPCGTATQEIERVARVAFSRPEGRRNKLISVDKANVLETSRLWRQVVTASRRISGCEARARSRRFFRHEVDHLAVALRRRGHGKFVRRHAFRRIGGSCRLAGNVGFGQHRRQG